MKIRFYRDKGKGFDCAVYDFDRLTIQNIKSSGKEITVAFNKDEFMHQLDIAIMRMSNGAFDGAYTEE